jgi:hypothetical protein
MVYDVHCSLCDYVVGVSSLEDMLVEVYLLTLYSDGGPSGNGFDEEPKSSGSAGD